MSVEDDVLVGDLHWDLDTSFGNIGPEGGVGLAIEGRHDLDFGVRPKGADWPAYNLTPG
jgi:hypothetical protein